MIKPDEVQFVYGVKLHIPHHGVATEGYGVGKASYDSKGKSSTVREEEGVSLALGAQTAICDMAPMFTAKLSFTESIY